MTKLSQEAIERLRKAREESRANPEKAREFTQSWPEIRDTEMTTVVIKRKKQKPRLT